MCGRFSLGFPVPVVSDEFDVSEVDYHYLPRYNIAPTQQVAAVVGPTAFKVAKQPVGNILTGFKWGLVPAWAKDPQDMGAKLINARCETAAEKPSFRSAFKSRRCIIPASGFYEWQSTRRGKQPHYFQLRGGDKPMALAGLWEQWRSKDAGSKEVLRTCTILTTKANELMKPIHDRMPVILEGKAERQLWLDGDVVEREALEALMMPMEADRMEAWAVSKRVNSVTNEGEGLVKRLAGLDFGR